MKKSNAKHKLHTLELRKEILVHLDHDALKNVIGGNNSTRPSQCFTLCF